MKCQDDGDRARYISGNAKQALVMHWRILKKVRICTLENGVTVRNISDILKSEIIPLCRMGSSWM